MHENRFAALGVAAVSVVFFMMFAFLLVVAVWIALSIYALAKAIGSAPDDASPRTVLLIVVGLVGLFTVGFALAVRMLGRSMVERRRRGPTTGFEESGL
jgi:tellurite resistance protein TehA-like permease